MSSLQTQSTEMIIRAPVRIASGGGRDKRFHDELVFFPSSPTADKPRARLTINISKKTVESWINVFFMKCVIW